jgi:hypothetical protein
MKNIIKVIMVAFIAIATTTITQAQTNYLRLNPSRQHLVTWRFGGDVVVADRIIGSDLTVALSQALIARGQNVTPEAITNLAARLFVNNPRNEADTWFLRVLDPCEAISATVAELLERLPALLARAQEMDGIDADGGLNVQNFALLTDGCPEDEPCVTTPAPTVTEVIRETVTITDTIRHTVTINDTINTTTYSFTCKGTNFVQVAATYTFDNGFGVYGEYGGQRGRIRTSVALGVSQGKIGEVDFTRITGVAKVGVNVIDKPRFVTTIGGLGGFHTIDYRVGNKTASFTPVLCIGGYAEAAWKINQDWGVFAGVQYTTSKASGANAETVQTTTNNNGEIKITQDRVVTNWKINYNSPTVSVGVRLRF